MDDKSTYPNIERLNPKYCISGKIRRCHRLIAQIFRKYIAPFNITSSQLSILFVIAKKAVVTQTVLASTLVLEKSTVNRNLRRLFEKDYVVKEENKTLTLTKTGKDLLEQIIPAWEKAMEETTEILEEEGIAALEIVLAKLQF